MSHWVKGSISLALAFILVACSGNNESTETTESEMETSESIVVTEYGPLMARYLNQMNPDRYYMRYRTETEGFGEEQGITEIAYAVDGDLLAVETDSKLYKSTMVIKDKKMYVIQHNEKTVYFMDLIDEEEPGVGVEGPMDLTNFAFVDSGSEDGMDFETYQYEDFTYTYYFSGGELIKVVVEYPEVKTTMELLEKNDDPPKEIFEIPKDYEMKEFDEMFEESESSE